MKLPVHKIVWEAVDEMATGRLGQILAELLPDGAVVSLNGTLGAGKTRLVQAVALACGVAPHTAVSPTFVLCQTYPGRRVVRHLDAYRLRDDDEFLELGISELFDAPGVTLVEWGQRVHRCLPPDTLEIEIEVTGETGRRFELRVPALPSFAPLIARLHHSDPG